MDPFRGLTPGTCQKCSPEQFRKCRKKYRKMYQSPITGEELLSPCPCYPTRTGDIDPDPGPSSTRGRSPRRSDDSRPCVFLLNKVNKGSAWLHSLYCIEQQLRYLRLQGFR